MCPVRVFIVAGADGGFRRTRINGRITVARVLVFKIPNWGCFKFVVRRYVGLVSF